MHLSTEIGYNIGSHTHTNHPIALQLFLMHSFEITIYLRLFSSFVLLFLFIMYIFFSQKTYWIQTKLNFETLRIFSIKNLFYKFLFTYERTHNYTLFRMFTSAKTKKKRKNNNKNENTKFIISFNKKLQLYVKKTEIFVLICIDSALHTLVRRRRWIRKK